MNDTPPGDRQSPAAEPASVRQWWRQDVLAARRPRLVVRNAVAAALRGWFDEEGFTEVETPALQLSPGLEPQLRAFATRLFEPFEEEGDGVNLYLHTSPEFAMKKLLAGGMERIFQLARVWRNAERSRLDSAFAGAVDKFTREFKSLVEDFTVDVHKRVRHQLESGQDIEELGARLLSSLHKEGSELSLGQHSNDGVSARELSPVVDRGYFKEFMDSVGGPEIVTPILSEFAQRSANCVTAFKDYLDGAFEDAGDEPARLAHELAGMCASVAAVRAREDATFLLKAVKDSAERDTLREHVARLVDSLDEAYETLDSLAAEA